MKVLICDPVSDKGAEILRALPGVEVDVKLKLKEEELCAIVGDYEGIVVRSETKINQCVLKAAKNLKVVGRAGVGIDNIDVEAATIQGVVVVNTPDGNTFAASELTMGMMLALARHIPPADQSLRQGQWNRSKYVGVELRNKNLGIVGFGKIGHEVAKRAKAFGMNVIAYDPFVTEDKAKRAGVRLADLNTLLAESDFITVHMPLTPETKHMIGKKQFALMKPEVRLLNVARGGIIKEDDLYEAVVSKRVAGAAIDVYEKEPITDSPLFTLPEVIVTPHLGASTEEAQVNVAIDVAHEIVRVLQGQPVQNAVNIPFIKPELMALLKPFSNLMEKLGRLSAGLAAGAIDAVEIKYLGEIANEDTSSLTNTYLKALLRPFMHEAVNYVNAPVVAKNRGIRVKEVHSSEAEDFTNKIMITVGGDGGKWKHSVSGSVFRNDELRILSIDSFSLDIEPTGHLVLVMHKDQPKMVGPVGMLLGEHDVNIAGMQLDREEIGGKAMMILTVDHEVDKDVLEKIKKLHGVDDAMFIGF